MAKDLRFGAEARAAIAAGIDAVADAVATTLGPGGRYVVVDRSRDPQSLDEGGLTVTNDGVTIARELELEDRFANLGGRLVREAARVADEVAGDGTTTSTVLARAIVAEAMRRVEAGAEPLAMRRGIERACAQAVSALEAGAIAVAGRDQIARVATLAAKDERIGELVGEAFDALGADGFVEVVPDYTRDELDLELTEGMWFYNGYLSPQMITDHERGEAELEQPWVLIANQPVLHAEQLIPVMDRVAPTGHPLLVIADRIDPPALGVLVSNLDRLRSVAVKARYLGHHRREHLREVALYTGGESVAWAIDMKRAIGMRVEETRLDQLGQAERVVVTRNTTTIAGGHGDRAAVEARRGALRREIEASADTYERERLIERLGHLSGRIAIIRVGAHSAGEVRERRLRVDDAVRATRVAIRGGILPGGGAALLRAADSIDPEGLDLAEAQGAEVLRRALAEPLRRIAANAGLDGAVAAERVAELGEWEGLDVATGEYCDLIEAGVVDPAIVARATLEAAASVAKVVLATEVAVVGTEPRPGPAREDDPSWVAPKRLAYGASARAALRSGVDLVARAVGVTLGPSGRLVVIARDPEPSGDVEDGLLAAHGGILITNDGVTVAREVGAGDPFAAHGVELVKQVAGATNAEAGDGTTTATLLAAEIVRLGQRAIAAGADPVALRRGIEHAVAAAREHVLGQASALEPSQVAQVAAISADSDEIGAIVAEAFEAVGRDGVVSVEKGRRLAIELDVALGMSWDSGVVTRDMLSERERLRTVLEDAHVLCVERRIRTAAELAGALDLVSGGERPLLIVASAFDDEVRRALVSASLRERLTVVGVMPPGFSDERRRSLEDIAILTGAVALTEESGRGLESVRLSDLGGARRVEAGLGWTTIVDGHGDPDQVSERAEELRAALRREKLPEILERRLRERLARLAGGVAKVAVGGATEAEAGERLLRVEDAVRAVESALEEGVVPGGATALLRAAEAIDPAALGVDAAIGADLVRRALEAPLRRLAHNSGHEGSVVVERVRELDDGMGFDASSGELVDLRAAAIIDPAGVVRAELENAASIAKTVLVAECVAIESPLVRRRAPAAAEGSARG